MSSTAAVAMEIVANARSWTLKASLGPVRETTSDAGTSAIA